MMAVMVKDARPKPADVATMTERERLGPFETLAADAGACVIDGVDAEAVTHCLDVSWNQVVTGRDRVENIEFDGRKFIMSTNPPRSCDGRVAISILTGERRPWSSFRKGGAMSTHRRSPRAAWFTNIRPSRRDGV